MYFSIAPYLYLSDNIYIYQYRCCQFVSISPSKGLCLCPPGHIVQTKMTHSLFADGGAPSSNIMWCNELREV
jgi:hypothetical protein